MKNKYAVVIVEQNSWNVDSDGKHRLITKNQCDHNHRTISGAIRCLDKLSKYWKDGSHNGWAHFGRVADVTNGYPIFTDEIEIVQNDYEYLKYSNSI